LFVYTLVDLLNASKSNIVHGFIVSATSAIDTNIEYQFCVFSAQIQSSKSKEVFLSIVIHSINSLFGASSIHNQFITLFLIVSASFLTSLE
jgi:hypothetical protein